MYLGIFLWVNPVRALLSFIICRITFLGKFEFSAILSSSVLFTLFFFSLFLWDSQTAYVDLGIVQQVC